MSRPTMRHVTPTEAEKAVKDGAAVLVDVRESDEVAEGMAAPAQWMATSEIESNTPAWREFFRKLSREKEIILYCAAGGRSGWAAGYLESQGFQTANMGGYHGWVEAGLPVRKP